MSASSCRGQWRNASADTPLEREIKNVVTVAAKTNHYWQEHARALITA